MSIKGNCKSKNKKNENSNCNFFYAVCTIKDQSFINDGDSFKTLYAEIECTHTIIT